jgi:hypothetical protein
MESLFLIFSSSSYCFALLVFWYYYSMSHHSDYHFIALRNERERKKRENQVLRVKLTLIEWIYMFIVRTGRGGFCFVPGFQKYFLAKAYRAIQNNEKKIMKKISVKNCSIKKGSE